MSVAAWETLADALLQREALLCRVEDGVPPHAFAGLFVAGEDVDRILRSLPGLDGPRAEVTGPLQEQAAPVVDNAREAFHQSLHGAGGFARLARGANLSNAEAETLALLAAVELSPERQRLVAYVQDNVQLPRLCLATLERMDRQPAADAIGRRATGGGPTLSAVGPNAPLRRAAIVDVESTGPWATRMCSLPDRIAWYLVGDATPDPGLPAGARFEDGQAPDAEVPEPRIRLVTGADAVTRSARVRTWWPLNGLLRTPVPATESEWAAVIREATIGRLVVVLELERPLEEFQCRALERSEHLAWVLSSEGEQQLESLPRKAWSETRLSDGEAGPDDWVSAFGCVPKARYSLSREQLRLVTAASSGDTARLSGAVRRLAGGHLDGLTVRVSPQRSWDDLVLPPDEKRQLSELAARHRNRRTVYGDWSFRPQPSSGLVALFAGPSGTGKTLAAEVVAGELGLDLYKVDLSSVVSKYIGETEKNLSRIFDAAAAGDLVLFFDEADALFGKRSEVSDAHDRYANIEVAYLLQRLESYNGLVILATNLQRNIDQSFLRRISVAVEFALPEEPQRRSIWSHVFPSAAPVAELDLDFLASRFKVTGGVIHNAALAAAFLAAEEGEEITMEHIARALRREFQKLGRLCTESEFERYFDLVNRDADAAPAR